MKFGKLLKDQISEVPQDLKAKFLSYKELKKQLKGFNSPGVDDDKAVETAAGAEAQRDGATATTERERTEVKSKGKESSSHVAGTSGEKEKGANSNEQLTPEELSFISKLNLEIIKFNDYFIKREEELIIRVKDLGDRLKISSSEVEGVSLRNESVHVHGELVLLLHWCELNYIGLVKILKKHDKKTGLLLRSPYLANVVQQPFCSTTFLKRLVKQVEDIIFAISPEAREMNNDDDDTEEENLGSDKAKGITSRSGKRSSNGAGNHHNGSLPQLVSNLGSDDDTLIEEEESSLLKQTKVAINLWRELQKSKTPPQPQAVSGEKRPDQEKDQEGGENKKAKV
jgi:SPX domain protein involved in polyphosphate accumulation